MRRNLFQPGERSAREPLARQLLYLPVGLLTLASLTQRALHTAHCLHHYDINMNAPADDFSDGHRTSATAPLGLVAGALASVALWPPCERALTRTSFTTALACSSSVGHTHTHYAPRTATPRQVGFRVRSCSSQLRTCMSCRSQPASQASQQAKPASKPTCCCRCRREHQSLARSLACLHSASERSLPVSSSANGANWWPHRHWLPYSMPLTA